MPSSETSPTVPSPEYQNCLDTLLAGGFVCLLPHTIDPAWSDPVSPLAGFPLNISYVGLAVNDPLLGPQPVAACYWFQPDTYSEDDQSRHLSYLPRKQSQFRVELTWSRHEHCWQGRKFKGTELLRLSQGPELQRFILQTEMCGPEPDEPTEPFTSCRETASAGVFVFAPTLPSTLF
jgi:hypothetical protein